MCGTKLCVLFPPKSDVDPGQSASSLGRVYFSVGISYESVFVYLWNTNR